MGPMVELVAGILVAAALLQILAAVLAVRALPHSGAFRFLWIALSLALVLMVQRRLSPLLQMRQGSVDLLEAVLALAISALLVFSLLGLSRLLLAIRSSQEQLTRLATTDALTGLANRRHALAEIDREWRRVVRTRSPLALLMIDIDHFKSINDRHGHAVGDEVLVAVATRCRGALRAIDLCGRLGGEEFVVMLPETDRAGAIATAERLRSEVGATPVTTDAGPVGVTISLGIAVAAPGADTEEPGSRTAHALLQRADRALYRAKADGRDCVRQDEEPSLAAS